MRLLILSCLLISLPCLACINAYNLEYSHHSRLPPREVLELDRAQLEEKIKTDRDYRTENDLGVTLLLLGEFKSAIALLEDVEKRKPGQFQTAANLGTAFELDGQDDKALTWIKEGVKRNPEDHEGTEWLHVKILEAKAALKQFPDWLKTNYVMGVNFGRGEEPVPPVKLPVDFLGYEKSLRDMHKAIDYQMMERLKFVKPPDPVIADLMLTWGDVIKLIKERDPYGRYRTARIFGATKQAIVDERLAADKWWKSRDGVGLAAFYLIVLIMILLVIIFIWHSVKKLLAGRRAADSRRKKET